MSSDAGPAPDYKGAAASQSNASHVNQQGVVGSSGWTQGPDGRWTQSQSLNGPLGGAAQGYERQIAAQQPLDFSSLKDFGGGEQARQAATDAAYGQARSRLDPMFAQQGQALRSQLAAQGLDPGSEAANNAQGNFSRAQNDAYGSAERYAVGQGQEAQAQQFNQNMMQRQQQIGEMLKQRGMPAEQLQQLMGMMGGAQGVGQAGGPNYLGAAGLQGNFQLGNADVNNQWWGNAMQGLGAAGGAAVMLSDERAKREIERLDVDLLPGVSVARWKWPDGSPGAGVIAQDVQRIAPECVSVGEDGLLRVDYAALGRLAWR